MKSRLRTQGPLAALAIALFAALAPGCAHESAGKAPEPPPPAPAAAAPKPTAAPPAPRAPAQQRSGTSAADRPAATPAPSAGATAGAAAGVAARGSAPAQRPEPGPAEYFPLAVGNEWRYVDQSPGLPADRRGVVRVVRIRERTEDGFFRDNQRGELRVDGDCVHDRHRRLLCQPFQPGATWSSVVSLSSTERYEIAGVREVVDTPAGRFEGCVRVRAHNRASAGTDHVLEITYAPGVGPVRIETYVVVDGKVTPQVKAMLQSFRLEGR